MVCVSLSTPDPKPSTPDPEPQPPNPKTLDSAPLTPEPCLQAGGDGRLAAHGSLFLDDGVSIQVGGVSVARVQGAA